jgi:hypothetical protein
MIETKVSDMLRDWFGVDCVDERCICRRIDRDRPPQHDSLIHIGIDPSLTMSGWNEGD